MTGTQLVDYFMLISGKGMPRSGALQLLNMSKDKVVNLTHRHFLPNLDASQTVSLDAVGRYNLSSLTAAPWELHNGIDFIRPKDSTTITFRRISFEEYQRSLEKGLLFDSSRPKYYCRSTYVYALPYTSGDEIDIYYRKAPATIAEGTTEIADFSTRLQDIIVRLACMGVNSDMYKTAVMDIDDLNNTRPPTDTNFTGYDPLCDGGYDPSRSMYYQPIRMLGAVRQVEDSNFGEDINQ